MPGKKRRTDAQAASGASRQKGDSPQAEIPTLDAASLQKLIRENELLEEKKRQATATTSEGSTSYAYQSGDTVHGKLDASKIRQQEDITEILQRARTNPWHLFRSGLFRRVVRREIAWRRLTVTRSFGLHRFISFRPILRMPSAGNTTGPVGFNILSRVLASISS